MIVENLKALLTLDSGSFTAGMKNAQTQMATTAKAANSFNLAVGAAMATAMGTATLGAAKMAARVQGLQRSLKFATGEASLQGSTFKFLVNEANRLGVSLEASIGQFKGMAAAARGTSLEGEGVRQVFTAIAEASTVMGLDSERLKLSLLAVQQMMSKGTIQAQELRLQLGESMPMAINLMAKSLGVSVKELGKLMEQGKLASEFVLPKFAKAMREEFAGGVDEASKSLSASIARMQTSWFLFQAELAKGEAADALRVIINATTESIKVLKVFSDMLVISINNLKLYADGLMAAGSATTSFFGKIGSFLKDLGPTTGALGIMAPEIEAQKPAEDLLKSLLPEPQDYDQKLQEMAKASQDYAAGVLNDREKMTKELEDIQEQSFSRQKKQLESYMNMTVGFVDDALSSVSDAIVDMSWGIQVDFEDLVKSILKDLQKLVIRIMVIEPILAKFTEMLRGIQAGTGGGGSLLGSLFGGLGKIFKMASGGIINEPVVGIGAKTGAGYMLGEKGSEAVMPVSKGSTASGAGGSKTVNVNINAIDSKSVVELMQQNPQAILSPIIQALQLGDRGLSSAMRSAL